MTLPRILVVDDQYAHNTTERVLFLEAAGLSREKVGAGFPVTGFADAVICSGQRQERDRLTNDYAVVREAVGSGDWALVLLDVQFDSGELDSNGRPAGQAGDDLFGMSIRRQLKAEFPELPVIMLTGKRQAEIVADATPYLSKHELGSYELRRVLLRFGKLDAEASRRALGLEEAICSDDPATLTAFRQAFEHAGADVSILILGESGVGKEVLAGYVHRVSDRRNGPYIAVNVAAIPKGLVESELFGIGKKIATEVAQRPGKFELASGGTLFLDEIGDMPLDTQAKVLRALQERKIVRVGEIKEISFDVRLVCATSRNLSDLAEAGNFRKDLLYRINTVPITMSPLRERTRDIAPLARSFLERFGQRQKKTGLSFSGEAIALLEAQTYPGNVRELENLVERLMSSAGHHQIIGDREVLDALDQQRRTPLVGAPLNTSVDPIRQAGDLPIVPESTSAIPGPALSGPQPLIASNGPGESDRAMTLDAALAMLHRIVVDKDDAALKGIKPRMDKAVRTLLQRIAGAALERCRDPLDHSLNRQSAMRLLIGDGSLKGKGPARVINEILGRVQEHPVTDEDLEGLVREWLAGKHEATDR